jgi:hypothetical protein
MPERPPFPFVVGCGRSGTTLVRAILAAHPDMAVPDESYFPVWLAPARARYEQPEGFQCDAFLADVLAHRWFREWQLPDDDVRRAVVAAAPRDYASAIRALYALYAATHGKTRYADKTPVFVEHLPLLAGLFPEAVFVHMVRDGRNVALSRTQAAWGTDRLDQEALRWRSQVERGHADGMTLGPGRYREVRYEDLVADTERVVRDLCDFVALDFDPAMLRFHERSNTIVDHMPIPGEHANLLRPPTQGLRDWRTELSRADVALFEQLAAPTLRAFGYPVSTGPASTTVRARAAGARLRYALVTRYKRARRTIWRAVHSGAPA